MSFETVPAEPTSAIWQGELVPRPDIEADISKGLFGRPLRPEDLGTERPVVTIGQPEVLRSLGSMDTPGYEPVVSMEFYVLRLWCSFHDLGTNLRFDKAHFSVSLSSADGPVVARDLHPSQVVNSVKRDVNVTLSPEVTFQEIGAKLGSFSYGFSYTELQPVIVAAGHGESAPRWTFSSSKALSLQGGKAMHLLIAAPSGTSRADAELDLLAYVTKPGAIPLPMGMFAREGEVPAEPLKVRLW
jgi:hypothetical protein